jgi:hypothetical protein
LVVTVKVTLVRPAAMMAELGTCARKILLLLSRTIAPPDGAGPFRVTVPVDDDPPVTEVGFNVSAVREGALTVRVAVRVVV